jgi:hypothetical protein
MPLKQPRKDATSASLNAANPILSKLNRYALAAKGPMQNPLKLGAATKYYMARQFTKKPIGF